MENKTLKFCIISIFHFLNFNTLYIYMCLKYLRKYPDIWHKYHLQIRKTKHIFIFCVTKYLHSCFCKSRQFIKDIFWCQKVF